MNEMTVAASNAWDSRPVICSLLTVISAMKYNRHREIERKLLYYHD